MTASTIHVLPGDQVTIVADTPITPPPVTPPPVTPPTGGIAVPATQNALKTAVAAAKTGDVFVPAPGKHAFTTDIGYKGIRIDPAVNRVSINGPGAILSPIGVASGIAMLSDGDSLMGSTASPMQINADPAGPASDANGSGLVNINGQNTSPGPGSYAPTSDTLLADLILRGASVMISAQHLVYLSGQLINLTGKRVQFLANGSKGYGLHDYHAGAGPSQNYVLDDFVFDGFTVAGVILWNNVVGVAFHRAITKNSLKYSMRLGTSGDVYLVDCTLDKPILNEGSTVHQTTSLAAHRMALKAGLTKEVTPTLAKVIHRERKPTDTPTTKL